VRTTKKPKTVAAASRMLSPHAVCDLLGIGSTTLWRIAQQSKFPPKFEISPNRVAFREDQIRAWLETREIKRTGATDRYLNESVEPCRVEDLKSWQPS
jgi:predicted DNA-binding transcriptional regulator AlpA